MSFYNIAVSVFLAYSPIGSLALHNTVLLPGLGNFFQVPSEKSQLIEPTKKLEQIKQLKLDETNSPQFQTIEPDSQKLTQCLRRLRDSRARQSSGVSGSTVPEIAVDFDAQGNVTNVRLIRSSGNRDLDEDTLRQARNLKLKPASDGRQGVLVDTKYAIAGSCHDLQLQEGRRRRSSQTEN
ncbi:MAG: TonB family protein [Nostoc sp.]|uniref:energy transducer TonB n=1 Tax=Nostoc sp. TaxID=1180 RepID=UPI002FF350C4